MASLPPGEYEIRAELSGFRPYVRQALQLTIGQVMVVNITLAVGGVSEAVTVTGDTSAGQHLQLRAQLSRRDAPSSSCR